MHSSECFAEHSGQLPFGSFGCGHEIAFGIPPVSCWGILWDDFVIDSIVFDKDSCYTQLNLKYNQQKSINNQSKSINP